MAVPSFSPDWLSPARTLMNDVLGSDAAAELGENVALTLSRAATATAKGLWPVVQKVNKLIERPAAKPAWAPAPLLKRKERTFPQLGFPRVTDSLCPRC